jgi:hypothetical protein
MRATISDRTHPRATRGRQFPTLLLAAAMVAGFPSAARAQLSPEGAALTPPRVFLDCQGRLPCDTNHFRTEIRFVDWVQDRADADVHVIATSSDVGGGGQRITLDFVGRGSLAALSDQLVYTASGSNVMSETLGGITQVLRVGLLRYAAQRGLAPMFEIRYAGDVDRRVGVGPRDPALPARDPWNFWTFRVGLSGDVNLRQTSSRLQVNPTISADRVTEDWKIGMAANLRVERNRRDLSGGRQIRDDRDEWGVDALLVRSVSDHVSVGFMAQGESSIADNQDAQVGIAPAVEYNYFPYMEANRRQLTVGYSAGVEYSDYVEQTIFREMEETRPKHEVSVRYRARETWGNAGVGLEWSQYLHDPDFFRASLNGNLSFRITRGLDLNLNGSASSVRDQINIPLSDISDEDILLGRQNLPSNYQYSARAGLSYRWGSSITNIVNTRFSGGGGGRGN